MLSAAALSARLAKLSSREQARGRKKHISPLRGIRGVAGTGITEVINEGWKSGVHLDEPKDVDALHSLFTTAFEDGLVAIGLAAAALPDDPESGLRLARRWLAITDDIQTADALGWLMWGPALLSGAGKGPASLLDARDRDEYERRAAVLALLSALPVPIEGPAASGLRARLAMRRVAFVEAPLDELLAEVLPAFVRDDNPQVRKAVGRVAREWAACSPDAAEAAVRDPGGLHRVLRNDLERGLKKGRRPKKARR